MIIDSHAHYDDERFDADRAEAIALAKSSGVDIIINASSDVKSSLAAAELAKEYPFIYALAGIHPHEAEKAQEDENSLSEIERIATENEKVVAIGEIGLDYYYDLSPRDIQKKWFRLQMSLAQKLKMPVVIHSRDAIADTMEIIREFPDVTGVVHSFSGSVETLSELVELGYAISLGGVVTFKNAKAPLLTAAACPEDRLLLETDAPYLTPVPHRGERNGSHFMIHTAERIAELRGISVEELTEKCAENTLRIFNIRYNRGQKQ